MQTLRPLYGAQSRPVREMNRNKNNSKIIQAIAHTLVIRGMGKPAVGAAQATIVVIEPARDTVSLVVPICRVRHGLELNLGVIQLRSLIALVEGVFLLNAFDHEGIRLTKYLFRLGRVGILCQDGLEVCVSCVPGSTLLALVPHYLQRTRRA